MHIISSNSVCVNCASVWFHAVRTGTFIKGPLERCFAGVWRQACPNQARGGARPPIPRIVISAEALKLYKDNSHMSMNLWPTYFPKAPGEKEHPRDCLWLSPTQRHRQPRCALNNLQLPDLAGRCTKAALHLRHKITPQMPGLKSLTDSSKAPVPVQRADCTSTLLR